MNWFENLRNIIKWRSKKMSLGRFVRINDSSFLEGYNRVGNNSYINGLYMGIHSYIGTDCILNKTKIGRFTSIGDRVMVITGNHPTTQNISTSPVFYSVKSDVGSFVQSDFFVEYKYAVDDYYVSIGNDVWIGSDVRLMHGISIGDGAVVGSGAIVTRDLEPYSINVGIPAKKIKSRFTPEVVIELMKMQWWNWDDKLLKDRALVFKSPEKFLECFGESYGELKR